LDWGETKTVDLFFFLERSWSVSFLEREETIITISSIQLNLLPF
jgi:hypothetical protein